MIGPQEAAPTYSPFYVCAIPTEISLGFQDLLALGGLFDSDVVSAGSIELIRFQFYKKYAILGTSLLQAVVGLEFVHLGLKQEINDSPWKHRSAEQMP